MSKDFTVSLSQLQESIINKSTSIDTFYTSGVYFLIRGMKVVYVGQSRRVERRLVEHISNKNFLFDRIYTFPAQPSKLNAFESYFIEKLMPEYNVSDVSAIIKSELGITTIPQFARKRAAVTPMGYFKSISDAAKSHGITSQAVSSRVRLLSPGWSYYSEVDYEVVKKRALPRGRPRKSYSELATAPDSLGHLYAREII